MLLYTTWRTVRLERKVSAAYDPLRFVRLTRILEYTLCTGAGYGLLLFSFLRIGILVKQLAGVGPQETYSAAANRGLAFSPETSYNTGTNPYRSSEDSTPQRRGS